MVGVSIGKSRELNDMRRIRVEAGLALAVVMHSVCGLCEQAQTPGATNQAATAQAGAAQPQTVLRSQAYSVLLDVVVTEKSKALLGIDRRRFHVFEDGKEQTVVTLDEHSAQAAPQVQRRAPLPPHYFNNLPLHPVGSAVNVLLLDALNTPVGNQVEVRRQMIKYLETIEPGTTMAIFTLASRLRMIQGFTSNAGDLLKALNNAKAKQSTALDPVSGSPFDAAVANLQMMGAPGDAVTSMQNFQADVDTFQTDKRAQMTIEAMQQLARYLSAVPGRKNLIWFSGSFPLNLSPTDISNPAAGSRTYAAEMRTTSEMLAAARVAVYPIKAEGLATLAAFDVANSGLGTVVRDPNQAARFTMEEVAADTGGRALFNTNDFAKAVANVVDNGGSYYTIGYVPQSKDFHGQFRKFKVKVDDCDCQLEYRAGYFADPPDKPAMAAASLMATATLHGAPPSSQVLFQARVLQATDPEVKDAKLPEGPIGEMGASLKPPTYRYVADLAIDARTLTLLAAAEGTGRVGQLEFALVAYDAGGKRMNFVDRKTGISLSPQQYADLMKTGLQARMALELPAGENYLVIAVHDIAGARVGSVEIPLRVPEK
jgi:VWFA-related protein